MTDDLRSRVRALTRDQKLALLARAAVRERTAREARVVSSDGGAVLRVPTGGKPLMFFISADDLAL